MAASSGGSSSNVTQQHHHQQQPHAHPGVQHTPGFASPQSSALGGYGGGHPLYTLAAPGSQPPVPYAQQGGVDQYGMNAGMGPGYVVYYDGRMQQQMAPPPHMMRGPQQLYQHQVPSVVVLLRAMLADMVLLLGPTLWSPSLLQWWSLSFDLISLASHSALLRRQTLMARSASPRC